MARNYTDSPDTTRDDMTSRTPASPDNAAPRVDRVGVPDSTDVGWENTRLVNPTDRARWGPVWAGLLTALTTYLVLELLAYGLGLLTSTTSSGQMTASRASPWVSGILLLIAFFVGGFVAEWSAATRGRSAGLFNGFLVWALGTTLILGFSLLGLWSLFGALGNIMGQFLEAGGNAATGTGVRINPNQVAQLTQGTALGAFFSLVVSAAAAALGGLLGSSVRRTGNEATRRETYSTRARPLQPTT
jgi:cation transport ATPase